MTKARTLLLTTTLAAVSSTTFAFAAPANAAADPVQMPPAPKVQAQSAGLLTDLNTLLAGTVGAVVDSTGQLVAAVDPTQGVLTDATGQVIGTVDGLTGQIFDASGQLLATVDAATGLVLDPLGNVIGSLLPTGQPSPGSPNQPQSPGSPGGGSGGNPLGASGLTLALSASRSQRLSTVTGRGVLARTACSAACGVLAAVTIDGRTARRIGLGRGVQPVVVGTASSGSAGTLGIRLTSRARRALSRALPSSRTRRSVRAKKNRAQRKYRSARSASAKRSARRSYVRYRNQERRFLSGRAKLTVAAVAIDTRGRTSTTRRLSLTIKR